MQLLSVGQLYICLFKLFKAGAADAFVLVHNYIISVSAENAAGLVLLQYNSVFFNENFNGIFRSEVEALSGFYRQNNSSEFVNFSYYTKGSFFISPLILFIINYKCLISNVYIVYHVNSGMSIQKCQIL